MAGKKILMLVGDFTEEYEIFVFEQGMEAVGHTVHVVCPDKRAGDKIQTSLHDFEGHQTYTEKYGHLADINKTFSEVRPEDYDAVYCAGGRGPDEVELVYSGLMRNARGAQASAAHWEAKTLSDDDIAGLGYGPDGDEDHPAK